MSPAEFDAYVDEYDAQHAASIRLSGEDPDFFAEYKAVETARALAQDGIAPTAIMDFGAGAGNCVAPLQRSFPDAALTALDVSAASLARCRSRAIRPLETVCYDGERLPFEDGAFDLVFTACVFHHIPEAQHVALLREIRRTLTPGGRFVLFEHNPWNPLTQHAVRNCPFDANAVLIAGPEMRRRLRAAGFADVRLTWRLFFPGPLAALRPLERGLGWLPMGAQYSLMAR